METGSQATPDDITYALGRLRRDHPEWEVFNNRVWMAISRPTQTSEHIIWAHDLGALRVKLDGTSRGPEAAVTE